MKKECTNLKMLKKILGSECYNSLDILSFREGQEIYISGIHIIIEGSLEHFYLGENGEYIKTINCNPDDFFLIGSGKYFNIDQLSPFFRSKSKVTLKKVPPKIFDKLMENNEFINWFIKFTFKYLGYILTDLFMRSTTQGEELIKYLLKKECSKKDIIKIDNIFDFVDKHNINRSSFYKGIKNLEQIGEIKKLGKSIKVIK